MGILRGSISGNYNFHIKKVQFWGRAGSSRFLERPLLKNVLKLRDFLFKLLTFPSQTEFDGSFEP